MPDDDWALGQNEVDVRNEARNPLNAMPVFQPVAKFLDCNGKPTRFTDRQIEEMIEALESTGRFDVAGRRW